MYYEIKELPKSPQIPIPIGRAMPNTEVFAINTDNHKCKAGEVGELYIRGRGNGLGYWNNTQKTNSVFVQSPLSKNFRDFVYATGDLVKLREDGSYDFIGRNDNQIKQMGYRIELGEIEKVEDYSEVVHEGLKNAMEAARQTSAYVTKDLLNQHGAGGVTEAKWGKRA